MSPDRRVSFGRRTLPVAITAALLLPLTALGAQVPGRLPGEFQVDNIGAATYTIPIKVSPGAGGLRPTIALSYSSLAGDGLAGQGWQLTGLSKISRCGLTRAVDGRFQGVRFGSEDRYCLDGAPLLLLSGSYGSDGSEYRTELDPYRRVISRGRVGNGPASFEVRQTDGLVYRYGTDSDSRVEAVGVPAEVATWAVNSIDDTFGNRIAFSYLEDGVNGEHHPAEIAWTSDALQASPRFRLRFSYEDRPVEQQRDAHQWGSRSRLAKRLTSLRYEHDAGTGFALVHSFQLTYSAAPARSTGRSQLASVQQCGPNDCLPPTTFAWQQGTAGLEDAVVGPYDDAFAKVVVADHDGDGDADMYVPISVGGTAYWHVRLADARAANPYASAPINTGVQVSPNESPQSLDFNGDGFRDLLTIDVPNGNYWVVYPSNGRGGFGPRVATGITYLSNPIVVDANGDGLSDLAFVWLTGLHLTLSNGTGFDAAHATSLPSSATYQGTSGPANDGAEPADFDGDGRQDLLLKRVTIAGGTTTTTWEAAISSGTDYQSLAAFPAAHDALTLDVNGDGQSDIAYHDLDGQWYTAISRGNGFAPRQPTGIAVAKGTPIRVIDLQGDGRDDLLRRLDNLRWRVHLSNGSVSAAAYDGSDPARIEDIAGLPEPQATSRLATADVNGDGQSDLLAVRGYGQWHVRKRRGLRGDLMVRVGDGLGWSADVSYEPLSTLAGYTADGTATATKETLLRGGALNVVARVRASDAVGGTYLQTFAYWNAKVDLQGRGLLGFSRIRAIDSRFRPLYGVDLWTETSLRQDFPFIGRAFRTTILRSDGRKVRDVKQLFGYRNFPLAAAEAGRQSTLVVTTRDWTEDYDTDPSGGYDGQLIRTTAVARLFDFNHGVPSSETTTTTSPQLAGTWVEQVQTTYDDAARVSSNCLGLPVRVDITRTSPTATGTPRTTLQTFSASSCRRLSETVGSAANPARALRTAWSWTAAGQIAEIAAAPVDGSLPARRTTYAYPGNWTDRPVTETRSGAGLPDLVTRTDWSHGLDEQQQLTSPRNVVTCWRHDDFGRLRDETRQDGPSSTYTIATCSSGCFGTNAALRVRVLRSDGSWVTTLHDLLGREVGRESPLTGGQVTRSLVEYDALGRIARQSVPAMVGATPFWRSFQYDITGRPTLEDGPLDETRTTGATRRLRYTALATTVTDAAGRSTTTSNDVGGRPVRIEAPLGATTTYSYTPDGLVQTIADAAGVRATYNYDERGALIRINDTDAGTGTRAYNAFGELVSETDATNRTTTHEYDGFGRPLRRTDAGEAPTVWTYNVTPGAGFGLLAQVSAPVGAVGNGFVERYVYDAFDRVSRSTTTLDGAAYQTDMTYDGNGRLATIRYPATVSGNRPYFLYQYDAVGNLDTVMQDVTGGGGLWTTLYDLRSQDAGGRASHVAYGGATPVEERRRFDRATGTLIGIATGPASGTQLQNYSYAWDSSGNLRSRQDLNQALTESLTYDTLDRLVATSINGATGTSISYDAASRIQQKSDVGSYSYAGSRPRAATAVSAGPAGTLAFDYDAAGRMTRYNGNEIRWTSFGLPARIERGADSVEFAYGPGRQRLRQVAVTGGITRTTYYIGPHFEVEISGSTRKYRSNVLIGGQTFYSQVEQANPGAFEAYFVHRDHQGSVDTLSRLVGTGPNTLKLAYDAFGKRRNGNWTADPAGLRFADQHWTERGYTGHEHLDNVRLLHMNGRVQDPLLGVMLSPDPVLGTPDSPGSLNSYLYVAGNPLSAVDPDGLFLRRLIRHYLHFYRRLYRKHGREIIAVVAGAITAGAVTGAYAGAAGAGATTAGVSAEIAATGTTLGAAAGGAVSGAIASGSLKGAIFGAVSGAAFAGVDAGFGGAYTPGRVLTDAAVGGALSEFAGGDFGNGFITAGALSGLTGVALEMRAQMIEQSRRNPDNASGVSVGFRGDGFKLGGGRAGSGGRSPLGGRQGGTGRFVWGSYAPGSWQDYFVEAYAGPHDWLNNWFQYDSAGNIARLGRFRSIISEVMNVANIGVATPFVAASVTPVYLYGLTLD